MFTCLKWMHLILEKSKKIKVQEPVTGGHKSRFLLGNCQGLLEKPSILFETLTGDDRVFL